MLVLNADDEQLVGKSADYTGRIHWFSVEADNAVVARHLASVKRPGVWTVTTGCWPG